MIIKNIQDAIQELKYMQEDFTNQFSNLSVSVRAYNKSMDIN